MCMFHTSIKYILLHTCMCVWEHACLAAWHWLMVMISLESLSLGSNISVKCLLYFSLEMTINFITQPLSCFVFHLPNLLLTQNLVYPTLFSSVPPPAINNERSLSTKRRNAGTWNAGTWNAGTWNAGTWNAD